MELTKEQKVIQTVINKAWNDPAFKQQLIDSPEQAIKNATGESLPLPDGLKLKVYDQSDPEYAYFNIPSKPNFDELELTDEQLEMVAGGEVGVSVALTWIGTAAVVGGIISYFTAK